MQLLWRTPHEPPPPPPPARRSRAQVQLRDTALLVGDAELGWLFYVAWVAKGGPGFFGQMQASSGASAANTGSAISTTYSNARIALDLSGNATAAAAAAGAGVSVSNGTAWWDPRLGSPLGLRADGSLGLVSAGVIQKVMRWLVDLQPGTFSPMHFNMLTMST